jgi:TIR domain
MTNRRIFLSYTDDETPFVRSVAAELVRRGIDARLDIEGLHVGREVSDQLQDALRSSSVLVAFLGRTTDSPWLNFEIGAALGEAKTVLPVFLSSQARESAPPVVRGFHGIDAYDMKPAEVAEGIAGAIAAATPAAT